MSPFRSSAAARVPLAAALVLPAALLAGCSALGDDGCHGTAAELRGLAAQPLLGSAPTGAVEPVNYRGTGVTTGCDDDSGGKPWLHADRLYAFPGKPDAVIAHYTETARAEGWHPEADPDPAAPPSGVEGACWTRTDKNRHLLLTVDFRTGGFSPAPEVGTGLAYAVTVGTEGDGGTAACWD
ncbi:hypothetical protein ACKI1I_11250 [Streptomyces turgidiscabies]|uniref:Putative lipoprotein n=1 Tax=Streptomyces turgidiscabies (strain Car8) TaxID=698760 RepID=L7FD69_STRT8|nr:MULTISPECIES: hypothetical protein [Streptomyces]ELP69217.1 putative lipoprotein [Streptomyces turgidiscabies Car8]MDX3494432.1 hypothetical protein [Streptomyces turgidiscabies]GAQ74712.1 hypothetical protein T45_06492 [Streptomyces turgidiscabies]